MSIVARLYEPKDSEAFFAIGSATYRNGVPVPEEERIIKFGRAIVTEIDGRVGGIAKINEYVCNRGNAEIPSAGVAGVAVDPTDRQSGVGTTMLNFIVRYARDSGFPVSSLYPFRQSFYRRFGYQDVGKRTAIKCPTPRLPKLRSDLSVRKLVPEDWKQIQPCYEQFVRARSGFHIRDERRWNEVVGAKDYPATYVFGDPIQAYAIVVHKVDFWEVQKVAEVAWTTEAGYNALINWFSGLGANKTHITWIEPSDSPFVARYNDQGVECSVGQPIMYRITDLPAAVSKLQTRHKGEFTVEVWDDLVPENVGPWKVAFGPDGVVVERTSTADLSMHIREFASAFMGEPDLNELARNGMIEVRDRSALESASRLLTPLPVSCWDFF